MFLRISLQKSTNHWQSSSVSHVHPTPRWCQSNLLREDRGLQGTSPSPGGKPMGKVWKNGGVSPEKSMDWFNGFNGIIHGKRNLMKNSHPKILENGTIGEFLPWNLGYSWMLNHPKIGMVGRKIPMAGQANVQDISEVQTSTDTRKAQWEIPLKPGMTFLSSPLYSINLTHQSLSNLSMLLLDLLLQMSHKFSIVKGLITTSEGVANCSNSKLDWSQNHRLSHVLWHGSQACPQQSESDKKRIHRSNVKRFPWNQSLKILSYS